MEPSATTVDGPFRYGPFSFGSDAQTQANSVQREQKGPSLLGLVLIVMATVNFACSTVGFAHGMSFLPIPNLIGTFGWLAVGLLYLRAGFKLSKRSVLATLALATVTILYILIMVILATVQISSQNSLDDSSESDDIVVYAVLYILINMLGFFPVTMIFLASYKALRAGSWSEQPSSVTDRWVRRFSKGSSFALVAVGAITLICGIVWMATPRNVYSVSQAVPGLAFVVGSAHLAPALLSLRAELRPNLRFTIGALVTATVSVFFTISLICSSAIQSALEMSTFDDFIANLSNETMIPMDLESAYDSCLTMTTTFILVSFVSFVPVVSILTLNGRRICESPPPAESTWQDHRRFIVVGLCCIPLLVGPVMLLCNVIWLVNDSEDFSYAGSGLGIWGGIFLAAAGAVCLRNELRPSQCLAVANLVTSTMVTCTTVTVLAVASIQINVAISSNALSYGIVFLVLSVVSIAALLSMGGITVFNLCFSNSNTMLSDVVASSYHRDDLTDIVHFPTPVNGGDFVL